MPQSRSSKHHCRWPFPLFANLHQLPKHTSTVMATRRLRPEDWAPVQTRIYTRTTREPRDEKPRIPGSSPRARPQPINVAPSEPYSTLKAPLSARAANADDCDSPRDPEVVDVAAPNTWPRRGPPSQKQHAMRMASPSTASQCSPRQSKSRSVFLIITWIGHQYKALNFRLLLQGLIRP